MEFEPIGSWPDQEQGYQETGGYGVIGNDEGGWQVVFAEDGVPTDPKHRFQTREEAMDQADRLAAEKA
jgi:hypothetical protein